MGNSGSRDGSEMGPPQRLPRKKPSREPWSVSSVSDSDRREMLESLIRDYEERQQWAYREKVAASDLIEHYRNKITYYRDRLEELDD